MKLTNSVAAALSAIHMINVMARKGNGIKAALPRKRITKAERLRRRKLKCLSKQSRKRNWVAW